MVDILLSVDVEVVKEAVFLGVGGGDSEEAWSFEMSLKINCFEYSCKI